MEIDRDVDVLIVDDNAANLLTYEGVLEALQVNLVKAHSGQEALRHAFKNDFAAILMDVEMSEMNGFETAKLLRQRKSSRETPLLFITAAFPDPLHMSQGYSLGAVDYLIKPIVPEILRAKIAVFVELYRKKQELLRVNGELRKAKKAVEEASQSSLARSAAALRQERDFAESLIATAQAIVLVLDTAGRIVRVNPYWEELAGYPQDEIWGKDWFTTFVPESDRPRRREIFARTVAGTESSRYVGPIVAKSGCERTIEWSSKALKDTAGRIIGVLFIGHDITELRAAQQRALQTERLAAIGEMVAGLAHESRDALNHGQVCLEKLALEVEDRPEALHLIARLQQVQDELHTLYEDLRRYAAPIHLERRVCDLSEIWRAAWEHLAPLREGREAMLREEIEGLDLHCVVDPFRLEQVFRNLLENSLAACRDPVEIAIHCTPWEVDGPPALRVAVRDHGPGLGAEQKQRLFEPFYTTKSPGSGLGMAITQRIVEAHGGRIAVGEDDGPGAEIILTLPRGTP